MADETQETTPQETATVTEKVTDEALASAWDATTTETETKPEIKEETEEVQEPEQVAKEESQPETPEPPDDHQERSRLGRRLKSVEEKIDSFLARLEQQPPAAATAETARIPENVTYDDNYIQAQIEAAVENGTIPGTIMTPQDQWKVNQFVTGLQQYIGSQYATKYLNTLKTPSLRGDTPDDIHVEVVEELQKVDSPFNRRQYDNPVMDAKINYLEAKSAILQKRLLKGEPTTVFKGKPPGTPPTGTRVNTRTDTAADDIPELDANSQDFIKRSGMSMDSVKAALKEPLPLHLRGIR